MTDGVRRRILVVEDNAPLLAVIAKCLQQAGYEVLTARSGQHALFQMAEVLPDLIVTDVMMPGLDGFGFVNQIRASSRTDLIPVVLLTARDGKHDRVRGFEVGVDAYLTKPFEREELIAVIENIFRRVRRTHSRVAQLTTPVEPYAEPGLDDSRTPAQATEQAPKTSPRDSALTETENRVAALVAQGLSNKEIASHLGISYRTVEMHISNILAKKQLTNRVELALLISREQPSRESLN